MQISRALNLVLPIPRGDTTIYLHSMPISYEVFRANHKIISTAYFEVMREGPEYAAGVAPMVAAMALEDAGKMVAERAGGTGDGGVRSLLAEIQRLSCIIAPSDNGYETLPINVALQRGTITQEDWREVENALVFFILISAMTRRSAVETFLNMMLPMFNALTTSLNPTEYFASLPTLTPAGVTPLRVASSGPR